MDKTIQKLIAIYDDGSIGEMPVPMPQTIVESDRALQWLDAALDKTMGNYLGAIHVGDNGLTVATDGYRMHVTRTPVYLADYAGRSVQAKILSSSAAKLKAVGDNDEWRWKAAKVWDMIAKIEGAVWQGKTAHAHVSLKFLLDALRGLDVLDVRIDIDAEQQAITLSTQERTVAIRCIKVWNDDSVWRQLAKTPKPQVDGN